MAEDVAFIDRRIVCAAGHMANSSENAAGVGNFRSILPARAATR